MNTDLFPRPARLETEDVVRERLARAGCSVQETSTKGLVRVLRDGKELGVMSMEAWRSYADGRGWR